MYGRLAKIETGMFKDTYEFILCSVGKGNTLSIKIVNATSSDDREGHGMTGEVGRSDNTGKSLCDVAISRKVLRVGAEKLVRE